MSNHRKKVDKSVSVKDESSSSKPSELKVARQRQKHPETGTHASRKPSSGVNRTPSTKISPRQVSEGLKQLPPNAYQFVRESYLLLDSDGSGSVSRDTLRDMLTSLGMQNGDNKHLDAMLERSGNPVTFGGYLAVMGELLSDLPSQEEMDVMLEAFQTKNGSFSEKDLRSALTDEGLTSDEISSVMARFSRPTKYGPAFDAKAFANTMSI